MRSFTALPFVNAIGFDHDVPPPVEIRRRRLVYTIAMAMVIAAGLATRSRLANHLPDFVARYAGDTLWALTLFLCLGFTFPRRPTWLIGLVALAGSYAVEFSQLYRADWLNAIRSTRPGKLLLGSGFLVSDFICYTVGVTIGVFTEWFAFTRQDPSLSEKV